MPMTAPVTNHTFVVAARIVSSPPTPALLLILFFFFNTTAPTNIYTRPYTLSLHDALPISRIGSPIVAWVIASQIISPDVYTNLRSEEHTSELQSHGLISYAVFCLKKK